MDEFKPQNNIQRLAYEKRSITSRREFETMIGAKPWKVARTTARYWWENGITMPTLPSLTKLSKFFRVSLDELIKEDDGK